ncbi:uncharacterized protein LOC117604710 isoform X1 [Osmia lignaria lignaria]|uniref:uncharacterized protein LOC117604710 isoform X1 n=2 Tax=Osmia lignaria lignaria TaxID=1437193 RepID=UPI00402B0EBA
MSSKWNERLVTNFLKVYKQHPCLWNPYHKEYHNCREKNEALRKIIDTLGAPGFTVNDYLQQIRIIREKYKQEQARTIKFMQSQRQYTSPFPWYNIVAEMLTEVINEEEKLNSGRILLTSETHDTSSVLKSLSSDDVRGSQRKEKARTEIKTVRIRPCTDTTCDEIIRRSKSMEKPTRGKRRGSIANKNDENRANVRIRYVTCPQFRKKDSILREKEDNMLSSHVPTRDFEPTVYEYPVVGPKDTTPSSSTRESDKNYEPTFLQCPACGWETENYNQIGRNSEKPMDEQKSFIPCSSYSRDPSGKTYTLCIGCDRVTRDDAPYESDYAKKNTYNSGDFESLQDLSNQVPRPSVTSKIVETMSVRSPVEKAKKVMDIGVQCEGELKEFAKNSISTSIPVQTQVFKLDLLSANKFQGDVVEACLKIMLSRSRGNLAENARPISQGTREVQCIRAESKETQFSPKDIPETKTNETGVNTVNYSEVGIQNTVCVSDGTTRCVSLQTDEKEKEKLKDYTRGIRRTESKEVSVNMIDKASKGIQSTVCVSSANLCRSTSSDRAEIGTSTSVQQVRSVACVATERYRLDDAPCISDWRKIPVTRAKSHGSINHCVRHIDFRQPVERESKHLEQCSNNKIVLICKMFPTTAQEYMDPCRTDTCSGNIMNPTTVFMLQKLLHNILSSKQGAPSTKSSSSSDLQTDSENTCRLKGRCTIDVTEMMNKIKEYAIRALGSDAEGEVKEFHQKIDASTLMIDENEKPAFQSTATEQDTPQIFENNIELENEKSPTVDKEVSAFSESKDVYTNGSLLQFVRRDVEVQGSPQLEDTVCPDKCEQTIQNKITVGTQKRDPILVRVIKCNENQGVVRSDKETLTAKMDMDVTQKSIDKRVGSCGRSTCIPYSINRKSNEANLEHAFRKKRENLIDNAYRKRSIIYNNFTCDKNCKDKANSDWADVTNIGVCFNNPHSKIPLGVKLRK